MTHKIIITESQLRRLLFSVIFFSCFSYGQSQVTVDTITQALDTTELNTSSGTPLEDFYVDPIPTFNSELDSINYYSKLQERKDSIAKAKANLIIKPASQENKDEKKETADYTADTLEVKKDKGYGMLSMFQGNPGKAGLYSLIVPGLGQAYNKRWWKVPIAIGAEAIAIAILIDNMKLWNTWDTEYRSILSGNPPTISDRLSLQGARDRRTLARERRDYAWVGVIAVHIIVAADAFVDRHLIEFDVDDDLSIKASPLAPYPGLNIVMTF